MGRGKQVATDPRTAVRAAEVWAELAQTNLLFAEMAVAAQQTIGLRLMRMGETLADPRKAGDPEFRRMGNEKLVAASQATFAVAEGWRVIADGMWTWASMQTVAVERLTMELAAIRDATGLLEAQGRFIERSLAAAEEASAHAAVAASRLGGLGLAPIHKAARANARRLSREARLPALLG